MADATNRLITAANGRKTFDGSGTLLTVKVLQAGATDVRAVPDGETEPIACSGSAGDETSLPLAGSIKRDSSAEWGVTLTLDGATVLVRLDSV